MSTVVRRPPLVVALLILAITVAKAGAQTSTPPTGTFSVGSFETDLFTGASNAQIPIIVPPGAAGVAPQIVLRYNSATVDDISARTQAQDAGLGWTLDTGGYIVRDTKGTVTTSDDSFKLVYGGATYDLVKVDSTNNYYHTKDEIFVRLQYNTSGDYWMLWTKDGVQHRYGYTAASKAIALNVDLSTNVTYKYLLDQVTTASGVAIQYTYTKVTATAYGTTKSYDQAVYPNTITWAYSGGSIIGSETRQVQFSWVSRTDWTDTSTTTKMSFHEKQRLDHIDVSVGSLVRRYTLGFDYSIDRDPTYTWGGSATGDLTLRSVTTYGSDGASTLPAMSFSYTSGRLSSALNGIGGTASFVYEEVKPAALSSGCVRDDGQGNCYDTGPVIDSSGTSNIGAYIWSTSRPGTQPVYLACVVGGLDEWGNPVCSDFGIATAPDAWGFSTLLGYVPATHLQGTVSLYSTAAGFYDSNGSLVCSGYTVATNADQLCGGTVVGYAYVTKFDRYRVTSRTLDDGRGTSGTMTFSYTNLGYSSDGKEFRGHGSVHAVDPAGHYTDTEFEQDDVFKGRPVTIQTFTSHGDPLIYISNYWDGYSAWAGTNFPHITNVTRLECPEGGGPCRQIDQDFGVDTTYGNPYYVHHDGDASINGDERWEFTDWVVDATNWLHRPKHMQVTDASGATLRERWLSYDGLAWGTLGSRGLLTTEEPRVTATGGQGAPGNPIVSHGYDSYGNHTSTTDPRSCTTTTAYESSQTYPLTITTCLGLPTQFVYDPKFGVKTSVTDPNNQTTAYTLDVFGRTTKVTGPLDATSPNGTVSYAYLDFGNPALQRIQTSRTQNHGWPDVIWSLDYFDGLGRVYQTQSQACCADPIVTDRTYDSRGLVSAVSAPHFSSESPVWTTYTHDALGRELRATNPDATYHTVVYTPSIVTVTDERGTVRRRYVDAYNRLTQLDEVNGGQTYSTHYQYDAVGGLTQTRNHLGQATNITYDLLGRKVLMQDPNMGTWTYGYDAAGNLTVQTDAKNQTLTFAYDAQGRIQTKTYPGGAQIVWTYDDQAVPFSKGRLTRVVDLAVDTRFVYDALGEVVQTTRVVDGSTYTMSQSYDAMGRVTSRTFPDGETLTYTYNSIGWLAGIPGYVDGISYNARGQRVNVWYPNGMVSSFIYDPLTFRIANRTTAPTNGPTVQNLSFTYDAGGNITAITDGTAFGSASRTFGYDALNRLTSASGTFGPLNSGLPTQLSATYTYNAIGDPQQFEGATYTYSDLLHPSAVTSITLGASYTYDANGNMTTDGSRSSSWDADNRLTATTIQGGNTANFSYDYTGQRMKKTTTGAGTTYYPFPDYEIAPGGMITKYVRLRDEIIAAKRSTGEQFFYHADQLGSVHVITDINGARVQLVEYSPWGRVVRSEGTVNPTKGFNGNDLDDPEIGLLYYKGRYYIAGIGRFMTPDPFVPAPGNPQSLGRYTYVVDNPVRLNDPTGYSFFGDIWKAITKWARKNEFVSAIVGIHLLVLPSPAANLAGLAMLSATETGRYTLAATIIAGTAVATFYCGGCGVAVGALIGEAVGGFSAYQSGGDVLMGVAVGGALGAAGGALGGAIPTETGGFWTQVGTNFLAGAIRGASIGAASGFAGGRGTSDDVLRSALIGGAAGGALGAGKVLLLGANVTSDPTVQAQLARGAGLDIDVGNITVRQGGLLPLPGYHAITLGSTISVSTEFDLGGMDAAALRGFGNVMMEELGHAVQWRTWGYVGFAAQYIAWSVQYGYWNNPFEIGAQDFAVNLK
jgi:RHS repeat-associated protein